MCNYCGLQMELLSTAHANIDYFAETVTSLMAKCTEAIAEVKTYTIHNNQGGTTLSPPPYQPPVVQENPGPINQRNPFSPVLMS